MVAAKKTVRGRAGHGGQQEGGRGLMWGKAETGGEEGDLRGEEPVKLGAKPGCRVINFYLIFVGF